MIKRSVLLLTSLLLLGCSAIEAEKPVNYYVLDAKPSAVNKKLIHSTYAVNPIELPDYLNQPNIVLRDESQRLHIAYYHSWADDLASTIRRVVITELNSTKNNARFNARCDNCDSITITLAHFYPTTQGEVVLSGSYQIIQAEQAPLSQDFFIQVDLEKDGYEHAVEKMREALVALTALINQNI
jgi:uncharacterized lipoprotein YmbA